MQCYLANEKEKFYVHLILEFQEIVKICKWLKKIHANQQKVRKKIYQNNRCLLFKILTMAGP